MLQLLYVSGATRSMSDADLDDILAVSRANNQRDGVTGMLLWADGVFIQILEGDPDTVRSLVSRIEGDARHRNFMVVLEQHADQRTFSEWSMGFKKLDAGKAADDRLFRISRQALSDRISDHDGGLFLETVLVFCRDFLSDR